MLKIEIKTCLFLIYIFSGKDEAYANDDEKLCDFQCKFFIQ